MDGGGIGEMSKESGGRRFALFAGAVLANGIWCFLTYRQKYNDYLEIRVGQHGFYKWI